MAKRQLLFLLCAFLVVTQAKVFSPRDLADEVEEQAQELESIVTGQILVAHDGLDNLVTQWNTNSIGVVETGTIDIQQAEESINSQLNSIKDLANALNYDIEICTNVREEVLGRLPGTYIGNLDQCIVTLGVEATTIARDARYLVDVVINKVHDLQNRVSRCNGDILCLSPLATEIQLDKIRLPQNVQTEVQAAESLIITLRISVQACADSNVSEYTSQAYSILSDITACVERIMS